MKLQFPILFICISVPFTVIQCKPVSVATGEVTITTPSPEGKTAPPWLKFLKKKKTTLHPTAPTSTESSAPNKGNSGKGVNSERAIATEMSPNTGSAPPTTNQMGELANWLGIYLQPAGDILAQDRQQNPDSLYDELYLDWMKRDLGTTENVATDTNGYDFITAIGDAGVGPAPLPSQSLTYSYPAMPMTYPYGYSPVFPSLAGFKMQKLMAQAQVDAAMAAIGITTTPKPLKLKMKITVPGNIDVTQLGLIPSSLTNALPPGSTFELS